MRPDYREFFEGLKLAAIAIAAAALTATLVIGAGRAVLDQPPPPTGTASTGLIRTAVG